MSDLVGNPEDRISCDAAYIILVKPSGLVDNYSMSDSESRG